jgi:hypothetical protein
MCPANLQHFAVLGVVVKLLRVVAMHVALRGVCRCVQLSFGVLQRSLITTRCSMQRVVGMQQSSSCLTAGANNLNWDSVLRS